MVSHGRGLGGDAQRDRPVRDGRAGNLHGGRGRRRVVEETDDESDDERVLDQAPGGGRRLRARHRRDDLGRRVRGAAKESRRPRRSDDAEGRGSHLTAAARASTTSRCARAPPSPTGSRRGPRRRRGADRARRALDARRRGARAARRGRPARRRRRLPGAPRAVRRGRHRPGAARVLDVAYVGPGVLAAAVAIDKLIFKRLLSFPRHPQVGFCEAGEEGWREHAAAMGLPAVGEPARLGSSVGISKVTNLEDGLDEAVELARRHDPRVIVEAHGGRQGGGVPWWSNQDPQVSHRARSSPTPTGATTRRSTPRAAWS